MGQVYQATSFQLGTEVVTIVLVAESAVATAEMAQRSFKALQPYFGNSLLVLAYQSMNLAPQFVGPKHIVQQLGGKRLADFRWQPVAITR
jgi:hypothetical protein